MSLLSLMLSSPRALFPVSSVPPPEQPRQSGRTTVPTVQYGFDSSHTPLVTQDHDHPTYAAAVSGPE